VEVSSGRAEGYPVRPLMNELQRQKVRNIMALNTGLDVRKLIRNITTAQETYQTCFSCDKAFKAEEVNDREEGYFCNPCLRNPH
jgi:hypothetical protein